MSYTCTQDCLCISTKYFSTAKIIQMLKQNKNCYKCYFCRPPFRKLIKLSAREENLLFWTVKPVWMKCLFLPDLWQAGSSRPDHEPSVPPDLLSLHAACTHAHTWRSIHMQEEPKLNIQYTCTFSKQIIGGRNSDPLRSPCNTRPSRPNVWSRHTWYKCLVLIYTI